MTKLRSKFFAFQASWVMIIKRSTSFALSGKLFIYCPVLLTLPIWLHFVPSVHTIDRYSHNLDTERHKIIIEWLIDERVSSEQWAVATEMIQILDSKSEQFEIYFQHCWSCVVNAFIGLLNALLLLSFPILTLQIVFIVDGQFGLFIIIEYSMFCSYAKYRFCIIELSSSNIQCSFSSSFYHQNIQRMWPMMLSIRFHLLSIGKIFNFLLNEL